MENNGGSVGAADAAVLALLADTSRAGRGGWGGEGGYGAYAPYASVGTLQHTLGCARDQLSSQAEMNGNIAQQQAILAAISSVNTNVSQAEARATDRIRDNQINSLRESSDLARQLAACCCETQKGFLEQALKAQECCCETQKTVIEDGAKTRELISSHALQTARDQNNINATVAPIVAAIQATCARPPHHPC